MQSRPYTSTEVQLALLRSQYSLGYLGVNLPQTTAQKSEPPRVPNIAALLMLIIIVCLATLAVFANLQRFRRSDVESVVVRPAASATPQTQER